jgi:hypothetical protein
MGSRLGRPAKLTWTARMMIDDDTLKQLQRINDELMQLCKWLNEKRDMETSSRLIPLVMIAPTF